MKQILLVALFLLVGLTLNSSELRAEMVEGEVISIDNSGRTVEIRQTDPITGQFKNVMIAVPQGANLGGFNTLSDLRKGSRISVDTSGLGSRLGVLQASSVRMAGSNLNSATDSNTAIGAATSTSRAANIDDSTSTFIESTDRNSTRNFIDSTDRDSTRNFNDSTTLSASRQKGLFGANDERNTASGGLNVDADSQGTGSNTSSGFGSDSTSASNLGSTSASGGGSSSASGSSSGSSGGGA